MLRGQGEKAGGLLRPQGGSRDPGVLKEQAGSFLRPQEGSREGQGVRGEQARGFLRAPGRFQGSGMLRGQGGVSWEQKEQAGGFLSPQEGSRDPVGKGEQAGSKGSELEAS